MSKDAEDRKSLTIFLAMTGVVVLAAIVCFKMLAQIVRGALRVHHIFVSTKREAGFIVQDVNYWVRWLYTEGKRRGKYYVKTRVHKALLPVCQCRDQSHPNASAQFIDFLKFPREIRDMVYSMSACHYYVVDCIPNRRLHASRHFLHAMALIRTCHQIRQEAAALVFSSTLFCGSTRYAFYRNIDCSLLSQIRELRLGGLNDSSHRVAHYNPFLLFSNLWLMARLQDLYFAMSHKTLKSKAAGMTLSICDMKQVLSKLSYVMVQVVTRGRRRELMRDLAPWFAYFGRYWPGGSAMSVNSRPLTNREGYNYWTGEILAPGYVSLMVQSGRADAYHDSCLR